jgi:hypothetical protein
MEGLHGPCIAATEGGPTVTPMVIARSMTNSREICLIEAILYRPNGQYKGRETFPRENHLNGSGVIPHAGYHARQPI